MTNYIYVYIYIWQQIPCSNCVCLVSHVRLFATPWTVAHQAPLSMGIFQARILEWVAMPSSQRRDHIQVSCIAGNLPSEPPGKPLTMFNLFVNKNN